MRTSEYTHPISIIEQFQPLPLLEDPQNLQTLSEKFNLPVDDVLLIALNCSGIRYQHKDSDRGRFTITLPNGRKYFLALTITESPLSPFSHDGEHILLNDQVIADASPVEKDTCTDSYWRGGKTHLTLNSNSRSNCRGCTFCGTYSLQDDDEPLTSPGALAKKAELLQQELPDNSFEQLQSIGVVTGCFPTEELLMQHLLMIRQVFGEQGFTGQIQYIGSQIRDPHNLERLLATGPFSLYLTVEAFERREQLMKRTKASLDLDGGRELLSLAKSMGADTSFLYIAGLDNLATMAEEFPKYSEIVTRLPQVQTFQVYNPEQIAVRNQAAASLEYFLQARKIVEQAFPQLLPIASLNYRSLWYTKYGNQPLENASI